MQDDGAHDEVVLSDQNVVVLNDNSAAAPEAALVGGTSLGFCDPLSLDAAASKGARITYQWRCLNDDNLNEILKSVSSSKISIAPSDISKKDFAFKIAVSVTDFGGTVSTQKVIDVYRSSSPLPIIFIECDAEIWATPTWKYSWGARRNSRLAPSRPKSISNGSWDKMGTWSASAATTPPQASTETPRTDNDVCRDQTTNQVLTFEDAPEVRLTPVDGVPPLAEGKYKFELQVTDFQLLDDGNENIGSRFSSASVSLSMIELQIPDLGISVYEAVTTISKAGQINAETKVALTGVASSVPETSDTVRIDGMWEVSGVST